MEAKSSNIYLHCLVCVHADDYNMYFFGAFTYGCMCVVHISVYVCM